MRCPLLTQSGHWSRQSRVTGTTEYRRLDDHSSVRLDVGYPDHLAPLLSFFRDEPAELGGRHRHWNATKVRNPCRHIGIYKGCIDLFVQLVDDLCRSVLGRT